MSVMCIFTKELYKTSCLKTLWQLCTQIQPHKNVEAKVKDHWPTNRQTRQINRWQDKTECETDTDRHMNITDRLIAYKSTGGQIRQNVRQILTNTWIYSHNILEIMKITNILLVFFHHDMVSDIIFICLCHKVFTKPKVKVWLSITKIYK